MRGQKWLRVLVATTVSILVWVPIAYAESASGSVDSASAVYDGFSGNMEIRTNPATDLGRAYAHPAQAEMAGGIDFVAVGTYKGGAIGSNCSNQYDPGTWSGYYDGKVNGVYFCTGFNPDSYTVGSNPSFQLLYTYCPAVHANRWIITFAGVQRTCIYTGTVAAVTLLAALEVTNGTTDRNVDVRYTNLLKNLTGSTSWSNLGDTRPGFASPDYSFTYTSTTKFDVYLAPLN